MASARIYSALLVAQCSVTTRQRSLNADFRSPMMHIVWPEAGDPMEEVFSITRDIVELLPIFNQNKDRFLMECKVEETLVGIVAEAEDELPIPSGKALE